MSLVALELLQNLGLLEKNCEVSDLSRFQPKQLQGLLEFYARERVKRVDDEVNQTRSSPQELSALISSVSARNAAEPLLPSTFAFHRLYANDPVFTLAQPSDEATRVHRMSLGMEPDPPPNLWRVANALNYYFLLYPLISDGIIVTLPLALLHAPPEHRPIFFSEDGFRSEVPPHVHDFVHQSAVVREMHPDADGKGMVVLKESPQKPTRGIAITFENDETATHSSFYTLQQLQMLERIDEEHFRFAQTLDWSSPPSKEQFDAWVYQSINKTAIARIEDAARETMVAADLGACYLTESGFEATLCGMSLEKGSRPESRVNAVNFLRANCSHLQIGSAEVVARVRSSHPELFEKFQHSLLAIALQLNGSDENFDERSQQLFESEVIPQLNDLRTALAKVAGGIGGGLVLGTTSMLMALLSKPDLPLSLVVGLGGTMAVGRALPSVAEFLTRRPGPAYIWKQIVK